MLNLMKIENIVSKQQISKGPVDVPVTQEARCFVICEYNIWMSYINACYLVDQIYK